MSDILTVYHIPPQREFRAADECDRAGIRYELLTEVVTTRRAGSTKPVNRTVPVIRGYLPAEAKPHDARYIGRAVGPVRYRDMRRLADYFYRAKSAPKSDCPFRIGQSVTIGDIPGTVAAVNGEVCVVAVTMLGKQHLRPLHYSRIRPG